jgi:hypothetical protein
MKFRAERQLDGKAATGLTVPADVLDALSTGRRPAVLVTICFGLMTAVTSLRYSALMGS